MQTRPWSSVRAWLCVLCVSALATLSAQAHPISLISATVEVSTNQLTATMEVMCEDFVMLYGYVADKDNYISRSDLQEGMKKHSNLLLRDFMLRDRDGQLLSGKLASLDSPVIPDRGVLVDDLMQTKVIYHLVYPVAKPMSRRSSSIGLQTALPANPPARPWTPPPASPRPTWASRAMARFTPSCTSGRLRCASRS